MPSSKGKPTDPKLREDAKKEVMNMEKGGGKGQWSAWKASEMSKVYESKGGSYEETGDNPNQAKKGAPKPKKEAVEKGERKDPSEPVGAPKSKKTTDKDAGEKRKADETEKTQDSSNTKTQSKKAKTNGTKEKKAPTSATREQPKRGSKK